MDSKYKCDLILIIETIERDSSNYISTVHDLRSLFDKETNPNYTSDGLQLESYDALTVVRDSGDIVLFSGLLYRQIYVNAVRCLNRYYRPPNIRFSHKKIISNASNQMIDQQVKVSKKLGYDIVFISRELKDNSLFYKTGLCYFAKHMPHGPWTISPNMHLTCKNKDHKQCWQQIAYIKNNPDSQLQLDSISLDDYYSRFKSS